MSDYDFHDYPRGPGQRQLAEHEARMEQIREQRAAALGITVDELMEQIAEEERLHNEQ